MLQLWSFLFGKRTPPKARSGPRAGRSRPAPVRPQVEILEDRTAPAAIDAGGGAVGSFIADSDFKGGATYGTTATINTSDVTNPAPQSVYQTERYGNFSYTVPGLTAGASYIVRLDFAELYWTAAGDRVFNVSINGQQVLTNFDIYATAGGKDKAVAKTFTATANSSGQIVLVFTSVVNYAKVDGIEITPESSSPPPATTSTGLAIDAGGAAVGSFIADGDFKGGATYSTTAAINTSGVTNPAPQSVYQTERYGNFTYTVPNLTAGASYTVRLDFAELYWTAAGDRVFNVSINGQQVLTNFDIYATAGGKDKAVAKTFTATANSSGQIVLTFTSVKNNAKVDGIEISPSLASGSLPPSDWFSQNLHDAALAALARADFAQGSLDRADMLQLFAFADRNSVVSSVDLADLRTLVANATRLDMPAYVEDLANKVVNGNPANADYQGSPLAALTAGSPSSVMRDLVDKWFYGDDLPVLGSGLHYMEAAGSLFGSGPSYIDVVQGTLADCYFLTALAETAFRSPNTIRDMFIANGDGTYTVRFFNNGVADYVTVNSYLPATAQNTYAYANYQESLSNTGNTLWVALAEKAYAELAQSGWSRGTGAADAYSSIALGWEGTAVTQITARTVSLQQMSSNATTEAAIVSAFQVGRMIGLDTNHVTATTIVPDHAYVLIGYNASTQLFNLYNPWGNVQQVSWAQLTANFDYWSESTG